MLVALTVAPATSASCWSVMTPFSVALATSTCADADTAQRDTTARTRKAKPLVCIGDISFFAKFFRELVWYSNNFEQSRKIPEDESIKSASRLRALNTRRRSDGYCQLQMVDVVTE